MIAAVKTSQCAFNAQHHWKQQTVQGIILTKPYAGEV